MTRIARALADDDGSGWWGEEECGPGHVDAARRLAEAGGVSVLLERLEEVERERDELLDSRDDIGEALREVRAERDAAVKRADEAAWRLRDKEEDYGVAEARVASLEEENARLREGLNEIADHAERYRHRTQLQAIGLAARSILAQGVAAPLPGDTE